MTILFEKNDRSARRSSNRKLNYNIYV